MRTAKIGFILSMLALSCFLFACAETGSAVKPTAPVGKKTTIRIGSPFKGVLSLRQRRSSRNWLKREVEAGLR